MGPTHPWPHHLQFSQPPSGKESPFHREEGAYIRTRADAEGRQHTDMRKGRRAPTYRHAQRQKGTNIQTRAKAERRPHTDMRRHINVPTYRHAQTHKRAYLQTCADAGRRPHTDMRRRRKAPTCRHAQTQKGTNIQTRTKAERLLHAVTRKGRLPLWGCTTSSRGCRPPLSTNSIRRLLWFSIRSKALQKPSEAAPTLLINNYENIQIWKLTVVSHEPSGSG